MEALYSFSIDDLKHNLEKLSNDSKVSSVLIFVADNSNYEINELSKILKEFDKPILGGVFPKLIYNKELKHDGILLIGLNSKLET